MSYGCGSNNTSVEQGPTGPAGECPEFMENFYKEYSNAAVEALNSTETTIISDSLPKGDYIIDFDSSLYGKKDNAEWGDVLFKAYVDTGVGEIEITSSRRKYSCEENDRYRSIHIVLEKITLTSSGSIIIKAQAEQSDYKLYCKQIMLRSIKVNDV